MNKLLLNGEDAFAPVDIHRIAQTVELARCALSAPVGSLLPERARATAAAHLVDEHCLFAHCAVLLFPTSIAAALRSFDANGLAAQPPTPSVLVRQRLSRRHSLAHEDCETWVTRLRVGDRDPVVEAFLFPHPQAEESPIAQAERAFGYENHIALQVAKPSRQVLDELMSSLRSDAGLIWEGGGYTPHDGPEGSTVLYFVREFERDENRCHRWELNCVGDFRELVERHPVDADAVARAYRSWGPASLVDSQTPSSF